MPLTTALPDDEDDDEDDEDEDVDELDAAAALEHGCR